MLGSDMLQGKRMILSFGIEPKLYDLGTLPPSGEKRLGPKPYQLEVRMSDKAMA